MRLKGGTGAEDVHSRYGQDDFVLNPMRHETVVKLLVERNDVDADSKDENGRTPLSWAGAGGHEAVVKLLAERDDVKADSNFSWPMCTALRGGTSAEHTPRGVQ